MKQTKFILIAAGVIGLIACFLPYVKFEGHSFTFWSMHGEKQNAMQGLLNGPKQVYIAMAGYALTAVMGVLGMKQLLRWQAIVGAVGGLLALACEAVRKGFSSEHGISTAIGGKLLLVAALLAVVGGILGAAKPDNG
jgi:hypothetical protein